MRSPGSVNANRWHFALSFDPRGRIAADGEAWFADGRLRVEIDNPHPLPRRLGMGTSDIILFGNPIANGKRDDGAVLGLIGEDADPARWAPRLNGSFLVLLYDRAAPRLTVVNDRFASLALYYSDDGGGWRAASSLKWLWERGADAGGLNEDAVAEFLFLRRLLGDKTFAPKARFFDSASVLTRAAGSASAPRKYWLPSYGAAPIPDRDLPNQIAGALAACMAAHQSDGRRYGLLLSGGLDSRALLAAAQAPPVCFTTCRRENNESAVARELAAAAGAPFHFVPRPAGLHDGALDDAAFLTGGQQVYTETQFLGYAQRWPESVDTFLIGLGLDILYGGLYLPKESPRYLGRPALHCRLKPLAADLAAQFLSGVSYRLKQSDPNLVVNKSLRPAVRDRLLASVNAVMDQGRALGAQGYDLWEFMHLHNLSRHYSFPMMTSVRTYADCRAPALDNEVLDLSIRMSATQKVNGTAYQAAIVRLAPHLMAIRNANTNLPAGMPLPRQTAVKAVRYGMHKLFGAPYPVAPSVGERSWPSAKESLRACPSIMVRATALPRSEYLASVPFVDMDGVKTAVDEFLSDRHDHAVLLNVLLTLDSFLRPAT